MLHKISSAKCLNVPSFQNPPHLANRQTIQQNMQSPRKLNNNSVSTNDKISQLFQLIEQQKWQRQKDFLILNQKIKAIKCKHPVVIIDGKQKQKNNKNSSCKTKKGDSIANEAINTKRINQICQHTKNENQYFNIKVLQEKLIQTEQQLSQWRQESNQQKEQINEKYNQLQQYIKLLQAKNNQISIKYQQLITKVSLMYQKGQKNQQFIKKEDKTKCKQKGKDQLQLKYYEQLKDMRQLLNQLQDHVNDSLKITQDRNLSQLSALGEIVDKNLDNIYQQFTQQLSQIKQMHKPILNMLQVNKDTNNNNMIKTQIQIVKQNYKSNQIQISLLNQKMGQLKHNFVALQSSFENMRIEVQNQKIWVNTQQSISSIPLIDLNPSALNKNEENEKVKENKEIANLANKLTGEFEGKLNDAIQVMSQNWTYLQTRNISIQQNMQQVVQLLNGLLSKIKKYF